MDLYRYLSNSIDINKIKEFNGDEYELALVRYVLKETSVLFYRNEIFFLNNENIKERRLIYSNNIDPHNIINFDIVCSIYCTLLKEVLKKQYCITTKLIKTDFDMFKHIALILITKKGNQFFIDPLMELAEMKAKMKTNYFATKQENNNPYVKVRIDDLNFINQEVLKKIDDKIGYTNNQLYTDDILYKLKKQLENLSDGYSNHILGFKILTFLELIRKPKKITGIVELMIFVKSSLKILLQEEERNLINMYDFFVDEDDLEDEDISIIFNNNLKRKRGVIIEFENICIVISTDNSKYLKLTREQWREKVKKNRIFERKTEYINLYKYLCELDLEPNILDHREFLIIIKKIENRIINEGNDPKDYVCLKNKEKILIKYKDIFLEIGIENDLLTLFDKNKKQKITIQFNDEGRNVKYIVN